MPRTKNEALTIRTTGEVKVLPALAAERERCFAASMVEMLDYAKAHGLAVATKGVCAKGPRQGSLGDGSRARAPSDATSTWPSST